MSDIFSFWGVSVYVCVRKMEFEFAKKDFLLGCCKLSSVCILAEPLFFSFISTNNGLLSYFFFEFMKKTALTLQHGLFIGKFLWLFLLSFIFQNIGLACCLLHLSFYLSIYLSISDHSPLSIYLSMFISHYVCIYLSIYLSIHLIMRNPHAIMDKMLECNLKVSEYKLQSCYCIHFQTNALWKGMKPISSHKLGLK